MPPPDVSTINAALGSRELSAVTPSGPVPVSMPVPFQIQDSQNSDLNLNHLNQNLLPRAESFTPSTPNTSLVPRVPRFNLSYDGTTSWPAFLTLFEFNARRMGYSEKNNFGLFATP